MSGATRRVTLRGMARPFLRVALFLVERAALFIRQRTSPLKATKKSTTNYNCSCCIDVNNGAVLSGLTQRPVHLSSSPL